MRPTYKNPIYEGGINRERENWLVCLTLVQVSAQEKMRRSQNSLHTLFVLLSLMFSMHRRREGAYVLPLQCIYLPRSCEKHWHACYLCTNLSIAEKEKDAYFNRTFEPAFTHQRCEMQAKRCCSLVSPTHDGSRGGFHLQFTSIVFTFESQYKLFPRIQ